LKECTIELEAKLAASLSRTTEQQRVIEELTRQSIEKSMQGAIRLCMISPSVNVSVNDRRNERIQLVSEVPEAELRDAIERKVLPKFTKLFVQRYRGLAPDNRTDLEAWLSGHIRELQGAVERSLRAVFVKQGRDAGALVPAAR